MSAFSAEVVRFVTRQRALWLDILCDIELVVGGVWEYHPMTSTEKRRHAHEECFLQDCLSWQAHREERYQFTHPYGLNSHPFVIPLAGCANRPTPTPTPALPSKDTLTFIHMLDQTHGWALTQIPFSRRRMVVCTGKLSCQLYPRLLSKALF